MITVDGVRITDGIKEIMQEWQNEEVTLLNCDVEALENAVCFIACLHDNHELYNEKEALTIISGLGLIRKKLKKFTGKEYCLSLKKVDS